MPFVPVLNTALIEVRMGLDGQKVENTLYVEQDIPWTSELLNVAATTTIDWWIANYAPIVSDLVDLREVTVTDLTSATSGQVSVPAVDASGGFAGGSAPSNVSFCVSFRTALRGRAFRGRNYIVGVPLAQLVGVNNVLSVYANNAGAAYAQFGEDMLANDFHWVVVSRFSGVDPETGNPIPRVAGVTTPVISVVTVDTTLDSQRRRLPGRGT